MFRWIKKSILERQCSSNAGRELNLIRPLSIDFPEAARELFVRAVHESGEPYLCDPEFLYGTNPLKLFASAATHHYMEGILRDRWEDYQDTAARDLLILPYMIAYEFPEPLLIHNFSIDEHLCAPPTKPNDFSYFPAEKTGKAGYVSEAALLGFMTMCGLKPARFPSEQGGLPYNHITPREGSAASKTNAGALDFPWHTEGTYLSDNRMVLMLLCLRNQKTPTTLATIKDVQKIFARHFLEEELQLLEQPVFAFLADESYGVGHQSCTRSMIQRDTDGTWVEMQMQGNLDRLRVDEAAAQRLGIDTQCVSNLIQKVATVLSTLNQGVILRRGDLIIVPNTTNIHSRTPLHPDDLHEGEERHLIRVHAVRNNDLQIFRRRPIDLGVRLSA